MVCQSHPTPPCGLFVEVASLAVVCQSHPTPPCGLVVEVASLAVVCQSHPTPPCGSLAVVCQSHPTPPCGLFVEVASLAVVCQSHPTPPCGLFVEVAVAAAALRPREGRPRSRRAVAVRAGQDGRAKICHWTWLAFEVLRTNHTKLRRRETGDSDESLANSDERGEEWERDAGREGRRKRWSVGRSGK